MNWIEIGFWALVGVATLATGYIYVSIVVSLGSLG